MDDLEAVTVVDVATCDSHGGLWHLWFFFDGCDVPAFHCCDTKALRIMHVFYKEVRTTFKVLDGRREIIEVDVVTKDRTHIITVYKTFCEAESLSNAFGFVLHAVAELTTKLCSTSKEARHLVDVIVTRNNHNLRDARIQENLERVENEWFVVDREETLVRDLREGPKPGATAAANKDAFHTRDSRAFQNAFLGPITQKPNDISCPR